MLTKQGHNDMKTDMINIQHKLVVIAHLLHEYVAFLDLIDLKLLSQTSEHKILCISYHKGLVFLEIITLLK